MSKEIRLTRTKIHTPARLGRTKKQKDSSRLDCHLSPMLTQHHPPEPLAPQSNHVNTHTIDLRYC